MCCKAEMGISVGQKVDTYTMHGAKVLTRSGKINQGKENAGAKPAATLSYAKDTSQ